MAETRNYAEEGFADFIDRYGVKDDNVIDCLSRDHERTVRLL
jgi:hypothetical protein